jgi:hypothetical protein
VGLRQTSLEDLVIVLVVSIPAEIYLGKKLCDITLRIPATLP